MEILICQGCGQILRGKTKACSGCGATISKHSPTALPVISHTSAPLAVALSPDPIVLEKAVNRYQYRNLYTTSHSYASEDGNGNGNGHDNGNGGGSAAATWGTPHAAPVNVAPQSPTSIDFATGRPTTDTPAAPVTQSRLGSLMGSAASLMPGTAGGASDVSGLISLESVSESPQLPALSPNNEPHQMVVSDDSFAMPQESETIQPTIEATVVEEPVAPAEEKSAGIPPLAAAAAGFAAGAATAAIAGALYHSGQASSAANRPEGYKPVEVPPITEQPASFIAEPASNVALAAAGQPHASISLAAAPGLPQPPSAPPPVLTENPVVNEGQLTGAFAKPDFFAAGPMGHPAPDAFLPFGMKPPDAQPATAQPSAPSEAQAATEAPPVSEAAAPTEAPAAAEAVATGTASGAEVKVEVAAPVVAPPPPVEAPAPFVAPPSGSFFDSPGTSAANPASAAPSDFFSQGAPARPAAAAPGSPSLSQPEFKNPPKQGDPGFFGGSSSGPVSGAPSTTGSGVIDQAASGAQPSIIAEAIARAQRAAREGSEGGQSGKKDEAASSDDASPKPKFKDNLFDEPKTKVVVHDEDDDDDDDKDDDDDDDKKPKRRPRLEDRVADQKTITVLGLPMKMQTLMTGLIVFFMLAVPILGIMSTVFGSLGSSISQATSGGGQPGAQPGGQAMVSSSDAVLSGKWQTLTNKEQGKMVMIQDGNKINGSGQDKYGMYYIQGLYKDGRIELGKQYVDDEKKARGKPIALIANVIPGNDAQGQPPQFRGAFKYTKRVGYGWRGTIKTFTGEWKGYMQENFAAGTTIASSGGGEMASTPGGVPANLNIQGPGSDPKKMHSFFLQVALGIIGIGCVLAMVSLKLFGPSGMINIWAKKKYIPSQFTSQHLKMVKEFGKPLKPGGLPVGTRVDWNLMSFYLPRALAMPPDTREQNPHIMLLGGASKGKSRLMASMIAHDIASADRAVVLVDSDGGLVDLLMDWVAAHPKGRDMAKRIVMIDPTSGDVDHQIGYNPLEFPEDGDLQNAASAVVFGFKAIYTEPPGAQSQWNQQTANILRNAAILLMANGKTLTDLPTLLAENDFRDVLLEKVERIKSERAEYITLIDAWNNYKRLARTDQWLNWIEPILNRVQPMLGDPRIRPILTKPKGDLSLRDVITEAQVLFVKIPQGQLDQNANLLGSLIVSGLKQAALSLSLKNTTRRRPCALYLDEFDSFIEKETFDALTSETKKFQIGLIAATKTLQGLPEDYRNQVVINTGTMCIFALAKKDGDMLGPQMFRVDGRKVKHQTIQNIFNKVNTSPQFELISDEEKLNIDRVVGQEERTFFCYRVGTVAGVFNMKSPDFKDVADKDVNRSLIEQIYANRPKTQKEKEKEKAKKSKELAESTA